MTLNWGSHQVNCGKFDLGNGEQRFIVVVGVGIVNFYF